MTVQGGLQTRDMRLELALQGQTLGVNTELAFDLRFMCVDDQ